MKKERRLVAGLRTLGSIKGKHSITPYFSQSMSRIAKQKLTQASYTEKDGNDDPDGEDGTKDGQTDTVAPGELRMNIR